MFQPKSARELVTALGIGQFNATMVVPFMLMAPATTDPKSPAIILLVRALQRQLYAMGSPLPETGYLDDATAACFERLVGPGWMNRTWSQVAGHVVSARRGRVSLRPHQFPVIVGGGHQALADAPPATGAFDFLPELPGGTMTYVAIGGLLYYLHKRKKI